MTHPTAEMIYQKIVKDVPTMSKTTVYNTLKLLLEKGLVLGITITGTETRLILKRSLTIIFGARSAEESLISKLCARFAIRKR